MIKLIYNNNNSNNDNNDDNNDNDMSSDDNTSSSSKCFDLVPLAIFYSFSRFCEIGIFLLSPQNHQEQPSIYSDGGKIWQVGSSRPPNRGSRLYIYIYIYIYIEI